jgi:ABC-type glycerol-3-phosphate transport system substrate-binding protein
MVTPDWRIGELRAWAPQLSGRLAMLPLPRLRPGDAPTSTWGGTMLAIPRGTQDPDAAWRLLEALYLNPGALAVRARGDVVPPVPQAWGDPAYQRADPLFGGQRIHALLVDLARQVPQRPVTPYTLLAQGRLTLALGRATSSLRNGAQPQLEQQCQQWLGDQASALRRYIRFADASPDD